MRQGEVDEWRYVDALAAHLAVAKASFRDRDLSLSIGAGCAKWRTGDFFRLFSCAEAGKLIV